MTASCAKLPPAPPYSSGIIAHSRPACPALVQASRGYMCASCHLLEVRHEFGLHEAVGLLFQQDQVFRHP